MKKLFVAATLMMFIGSASLSTYAMSNGVNIEMTDKKEKKKKKKGEAKSCSAEQQTSCGSGNGEQPKSCCSKPKN
jgi:hypothetical protein